MHASATALLLLLGALLVLGAHAQTETTAPNALQESDAAGADPPAEIVRPRVTIAQWLASSSEHTVFTALLPPDFLGGDPARNSSRLTVFAPNNQALANLARRLTRNEIPVDSNNVTSVTQALTQGFVWLQRIPDLQNAELVLRYHFLQREYAYNELLGTTQSTMSGDELSFTPNGAIVDKDPRQDVRPTRFNIFLLNGWVNVVPNVLLPFNLTRVFNQLNRLESPTPSPTPVPSPVSVPTPAPGDDDPTDDGDGTTLPPGTDDDGDDDSDPASTDDDGDGGLLPDGDDADASGEAEDPDATSEDDDDVCFPADARVHVAGGARVRMEELQAGQAVVHAASGESSPVFLFSHRMRSVRARFVEVRTACGHSVTLTPSHYVRAAGGKLVAAGALVKGDAVQTVSGECVVEETRRVSRRGLYAPHSLHGDLVVDGVVCSGYSRAVAPWAAHALLAPVRWAVKTLGVTEPLGKVLYGGADWALRVVPRGLDRY